MSVHQAKCNQKRLFVFKHPLLQLCFQLLADFMYENKISRLISDDTIKAEHQILAYTVCIQQHLCRGVLYNINRTNMLVFNQFVCNRQLV